MEYYKKENGHIPVLDYLLSLDAKMRAKAFSKIELLENHGPELREPYVKPIKGTQYKGLFEPSEDLCTASRFYEKNRNDTPKRA